MHNTVSKIRVLLSNNALIFIFPSYNNKISHSCQHIFSEKVLNIINIVCYHKTVIRNKRERGYYAQWQTVKMHMSATYAK